VPSEAAPGAGASRTEILGFSALQLSNDRDPATPHAEALTDGMVTLQTLVEEGLLKPARRELVSAPPRIQAPDAQTRAVLGYLSTNCGSCHNADSSIAKLGLMLKATIAPSHDAAPVGIAALSLPTSKWEIPNTPVGTTRYVSPGVPQMSAVLVRMKSRRPSTQMPPLGTVLHDKEAIALVTEWIQSLERD
jgi:hypothetical protein